MNEKRILEAVRRALGYNFKQLKARDRRRPVMIARQVAMYYFRMRLSWSYERIGDLFTFKHCSVLHNVRRVEDGLMYQDELIVNACRKMDETLSQLNRNPCTSLQRKQKPEVKELLTD